jgi:alanyl-tRNA synthetase
MILATRKRYYEDCHLVQFSARVVSCDQTPKGFAVILDATAFYPEGGGQACDLGTLGSARVLDVREQGEDVIHLCDSPLAVGSEVTGSIDWDRRFDQMQQHTGEHILSGLINARFGYHNVGFHVGKDCMEVDFSGPMTWEQAMELEEKANAAIWQDLPIRTWIPTPEELPQVTYRSKRALPWPVRIVEVPGYDRCACCGVHVERTGEVGIIKIVSLAKFHDGVRLGMVCGKRAYGWLWAIFEQNRMISQIFSAKILDTGNAAQQFARTLSAEKARAAALEKRLFASIAAPYAGKGNVVHFEDGLTPGSVRELADAIAGVCGGVAAVLSGLDEKYNVCLIHKNGDVKPLGTAMAKALNGMGGGKPGSFQGTLRGTRADIEAFFRSQQEFSV